MNSPLSLAKNRALFSKRRRQDPSLLDLYGISKVGPKDGRDAGPISGRETLGRDDLPRDASSLMVINA